MGLFAIETLLLLYKSLFLAVVLYNAQAWSNLNNRDRINLQTIQLKYLKRMFHAPSSTSNCLTFLETGVLPIDYEIHIRQLMFLYHILSLTNDDPVRLCYQEQKKYPAPSWANEVSALRSKYEIEESDEEIPDITKRQWKRIVKTKVRQYAFENLIKESETQKGSQNKYTNLNKQSYLNRTLAS